MTVIQAIAIGLLGGTLGTTGIYIWLDSKSQNLEKINESQAKQIAALASIQASIHKGELELQKNLTAPDLLNVACSESYLNVQGDLLCREMFCRLQTREGDGASQSECEEIANVSNSLHVISTCKDLGMDIEICTEYIGNRK